MLTTRLYGYQKELLDKFLGRGNLLLAADMGTGKTIMGIAAAEYLMGEGKVGLTLIICPSGLKFAWAQEIAQHTDVTTYARKMGKRAITLPTPNHCVVVDGNAERRNILLRQAIATRPDYVIVGFDTAVSEYEGILHLEPDLIILDEASVIKNPAAERSQALKSLDAPYRIAATGTAIENRPEDIFSIMEWVDDTVLGNAVYFDKAFITRNPWGKPVRYKNLPTLSAKLDPAMGRITVDHPDVAKHMPQRERQTWWVEMDDPTRETYTVMAEHLAALMEDNPPAFGAFDVGAHYAGRPDEATPDGRMMAVHQAMLMLCCHPRLLIASAENYETTGGESGSRFAHELHAADWLEHIQDTSAKLTEVATRLRALLESDPAAKVIVFSAYRGMLPLLAEALADYPSVRYHGELTPVQKTAAQHAFQNDPAVRLFLSTHAGAYGLNLPAASWLINYDQAWSHGRQSQIDRRHVRASSQHERVMIVDVVTRGTVEERKHEVVALKGLGAAAILDGVGHEGEDRGVDASPQGLLAHLRDYLRAA